MQDLFFKIKQHLEELFGTLVGFGSGLFHIFQTQEIKIVEGCIYTFFISIFGMTIAWIYKKFLSWLDKKLK